MINEEAVNNKNALVLRKIKQYIGVTIGVIILSVGFYFFLEPTGLITGGMLGLSIFLEPIFDKIGSWFTASTFLYIINIITLFLGLICLGKDFFLKTVYGTLLSPTVVFILEKLCDPNFFYNDISFENKKFICLICGVLLVGFGVGIAVRNNGSTGGMDVIQKCMSKYLRVPMSIAMYLTDLIVVLLAGFLATSSNDLGDIVRDYTVNYQIENAVWGTLGVIGQAYIIDYLCLNVKSRRTLYVITAFPDLVKEFIYNKLDRGITLVDCKGGYTGDNLTMVICTMDKNEAYRITEELAKLDPNSFTFVSSCKEVRGVYNKRGILNDSRKTNKKE